MGNELKRYGIILWRWAWLISLGMLLAGGAAYVTSRLTAPVYSASATLLVSAAPNSAGQSANYGTIVSSEQLAETYSAMITKRPVIEAAAQKLNVSPGRVGGVSVALVQNTQLINLQVENEDPQLARDLANTIPDVFSQQLATMQATRYADAKTNLSKQLDTIRQQITDKQTAITALGLIDTPAKEASSASLQSEVTNLRQLLAYLTQSYENIRLAEVQSTSNIVIIDPAVLPGSPIRPNTSQNVTFSVLAGMILAIGVAFLIEYLDDRIRLPEQVERTLNVPILGLIARWPIDSALTRGESSLIAVREPRSPIVEAFRSLRTNIQFAGVDRPIRTLLITSAGPSEGKSTVAANLAVVMAQAGLRVTLVDGDLRRPTVQKIFEQADRVGLTNMMLQDPSQWNGVVRSPQINNLALITSGPTPPNPSEMLGSNRMRQFVEHLHASNDIVIIDAPPMLAVTDSLVLSQLADGVLIVVDTGSTRIGDAAQSKLQLDQANARVLGVVMNKIPTGRQAYYYYYYYHRYYDYSGYTAEQKSKGKGRKGKSAKTVPAPAATVPPVDAESDSTLD